MEEKFVAEIFQYQALIHKVCRMYRDGREDREDLFQEIIYQLWKSYSTFQGRSKISTWIYRISLNTAMASFRKPDISDNTKVPMNVQDVISADDRQERLFEALSKLNDGDKAIIALYLEDMNYAEIAGIIGITENYVGVRLNRIKEKIKKLLNI